MCDHWLILADNIEHVVSADEGVMGEGAGMVWRHAGAFLHIIEECGGVISAQYFLKIFVLFRQSIEGVIGASLADNKVILPKCDMDKPRGALKVISVERNLDKSPINN